MCDLKDAEKLDLLKLDVLSLDTLTLFEKTLEFANLPFSYLDEIPFDDEKAFEVLNDGKTTGLFQLSGGTAKILAAKVKVSEINDIVTISAMARPGPLSSGGAETWARRRMGKEPVTYVHPIFEPYLKDTLGVFSYQEQIMMIAHDLGGLDWTQVGKLRKAIGKSLGPEAMREYGEPFKAGLLSRGVSQEVADKFWNDILGCGSYLFSKNHAVPYGMMSYYSCYLKAHFPLEFTAAALTLSSSVDKQIAFLREMAAEGVGYVPFDPDLSTDRWTVATKNGQKVLVGPVQMVKGMGPKKVQQYLSSKARNEPLPDSLQKLLSKATTELDSLFPIRDAIIKMDWKKHTVGKVTRLQDAKPDDSWAEFEVIGLVTKAEIQDENDPKKVADRISRGQIGIQPGNPHSIQIRLKNDETSDFLCKVIAKRLDEFKDYVLEKIEPNKSVVVVRGKFPPQVPCLLINEIEDIGRIE
jgi:DNA polymerase III alpha subunit